MLLRKKLSDKQLRSYLTPGVLIFCRLTGITKMQLAYLVNHITLKAFPIITIIGHALTSKLFSFYGILYRRSLRGLRISADNEISVCLSTQSTHLTHQHI